MIAEASIIELVMITAMCFIDGPPIELDVSVHTIGARRRVEYVLSTT